MMASRYFTDPMQQRLAEAIERGDVPAIHSAIQQGARVNAPGKDGTPMLAWALAKQNIVGFETLLKHGADLTANIRDPRLTAPGERTEKVIELVVTEPNTAYLEAAMRSGFSPNFIADDEANETLLFRTIDAHLIPNAGVLIAAKANINQPNWAMTTPMAYAQDVNFYEMVWFLLERGANPAIKDRWGYDLAANIKQYGTRGVSAEQMPYFDKVVAELEKRGLITQQDIVKIDKPENGSAVTTIYHSPDSEMGRAIRQMDENEQEANRRDQQRKTLPAGGNVEMGGKPENEPHKPDKDRHNP